MIDTYTTDKNGQFTTDYYTCGSDWTIKEIQPSEGYLLDNTSYPVGADAKKYTVERNLAPAVDATEEIIKGNVTIIKHSDNGVTQIETPENGAKFELFLKSAGSYKAAKDTEKDKKTQRSFRVPKDLMENNRSMRIHSKSFCYALAQAQNWDIHKSYRIPGTVLIPGKIVVFDLTSAEEISNPYAPGND